MRPKVHTLIFLACVALARVPAGVSADPAPAPARSSPAIAGTVLSAASGKPIGEAKIELFGYLDPDAVRERRAAGEIIREPLERGAADKNGRFRIEVPAGSRIIVVAEAPGHARSRLPRTILVAAGAPERDLGRIELPEGARLTGRVLDPAGKPIPAAKVIAYVPRRASRPAGAGASFIRAARGPNRMPSYQAATTTGPDGSFTLDSLPTSPVTVRAYTGKLAPAVMEEVRASSGLTIRMARGETLSGKVVAPDGKTPAAGAWVLAGEEGSDGITRSKGDGTFAFDNLRPGKISIMARAAGPVPGPSEAPPAPAAATTWAPSAAATVAVPPATGSPPAALKLRPGGVVRARALDAETRKPVAGAFVILDAPGEIEPRPLTAPASGEVTFTGVPVGTISLRAEAEGYLDEEVPAQPLAAGQTRELTAAMRGAAAIEGTVRDQNGKPVAGAEVTVLGPPPMALPVRTSMFFPIGVDPVETDAQGCFVLERLPPRDELKIAVAAEGFAPWDMSGIKLRPSERRKGLEVLLDTGATISGRLIDRDGVPVAAASITASRRREGGGMMVIQIGAAGRGGGPGRSGPPGPSGPMSGEELPEILSAGDGSFRVQGARPGIWSLEVRARGCAPKAVGGLKLEESSDLNVGDVILEPGAVLRGRVVSATGEPVPYARGAVRRDFTQLSEFTTAADGAFVSEDLAPDDPVTLTIDADAYAAYEKSGLKPPMEDLIITLSASSKVRGQVIERQTRRPLGDFSIAISRTREGGGGAMRMSMMMGGPEISFHTEDGAFTLEDINPGKVSLTAKAPGFNDATLRDLDVLEGKDLEGLVFEVDRAASVSGTVTDDRGRPLSGVMVEKKESSQGFGMMVRAGGGGTTRTDGDGNFYLGGLERGALTLLFTHSDFEPAQRDLDTAKDIEGLRVALSRGAMLTGMVLHEEDGSPVGNARVEAAAAGSDRFGGELSATTGPDGGFILEGVAAGRYTLRAEAGGMRSAVINDVIVTPGASPPPVELRLGGGVTLSGTISGVKETELPQFTVRALVTGSGGFPITAPVDAAGHFEIKGMPPGSVTLVAGSGFFGGRSITKTVTIPSGVASFETTIEFPHGNRVEGEVTRGGAPVDGASVIFRNAATRATTTATADASGHYAAEDLDDGDYDVTVLQFSKSVSHTTKVTIKSDKEFDIALPLSKISGLITDSQTGKRLDGALVSVKRDEGGAPPSGSGLFLQQGARTDASGYYQMDGLQDGTYLLTTRKDGYGFVTRSVLINADLKPDEINFELSHVDSWTFRAVDAGSTLPLLALSALVLVGGGDPLAPSGSPATVLFQGSLSADTSGLFHIDSLQPGSYRVILGGRSVATETLHGITIPGPEMTIAMAPGGSVEVHAQSLTPGQTARAALFDAQGRPAHVNTFFPDPAFILRPDAPTTLADLKPGTYHLRVAMPGGGIVEKPVTVKTGETTPISIP